MIKLFFKKKQKPFIIGVCGSSCSGKSAVIKELEKKYPDVLRINQDRFFKKDAKNYERPESIRFDRLIYSVKKLNENKSTHIPSEGWTEIFDRLVEPHKIIIVEGYLLFVNDELTNLFDKKIYVEVSDINILYRRVKRDGGIDGIDYIKNVVIPESKKFKDLQKSKADLVIDGDESPDKIISDMEKHLRNWKLI